MPITRRGQRSPAGFALTPDQLSSIKAWEQEDAKLQREIAERQQRRDDLRARLNAIAILRGNGICQQELGLPSSPPANGKDDEGGPTDLTRSLESIVKSSPEPLTKDELKEKLRAQRFSDDRLGPYFYTVIARLKAGHRIQVLSDGRVCGPKKAPSEETPESAP